MLPVKKEVETPTHSLTLLETDELNDQYAQSWLIATVAGHMRVPVENVSVFLGDFRDYTFSAAEVAFCVAIFLCRNIETI